MPFCHILSVLTFRRAVGSAAVATVVISRAQPSSISVGGPAASPPSDRRAGAQLTMRTFHIGGAVHAGRGREGVVGRGRLFYAKGPSRQPPRLINSFGFPRSSIGRNCDMVLSREGGRANARHRVPHNCLKKKEEAAWPTEGAAFARARRWLSGTGPLTHPRSSPSRTASPTQSPSAGSLDSRGVTRRPALFEGGVDGTPQPRCKI